MNDMLSLFRMLKCCFLIGLAPSRDLDYHPRTYALDDQVLDRKYRNALQSVGNYPGQYRIVLNSIINTYP